MIQHWRFCLFASNSKHVGLEIFLKHSRESDAQLEAEVVEGVIVSETRLLVSISISV